MGTSQVNATEKQIKYARDLGLRFPADIAKSEMSDLIDCHLSEDTPSSDETRRFARWFGFDQFTAYIGERKLSDRLVEWLNQPDREEDLTSWFIFRVCRHIFKPDHPRATGPDCVAVREMATEFMADNAAMKSLRRYRGPELIRFGVYLLPDRTEVRGGSVRTAAYQRAASLIAEHLPER